MMSPAEITGAIKKIVESAQSVKSLMERNFYRNALADAVLQLQPDEAVSLFVLDSEMIDNDGTRLKVGEPGWLHQIFNVRIQPCDGTCGHQPCRGWRVTSLEPRKARSLEEIGVEAEKIRKEIDNRKSSYAAAVEVAEIAELVRDLAHHLAKKE